ncbi:hypothetical protein EHO61_06500 [Leptospira fluminis]|uniref:Uncharacterized protein n=1 Tax=Leptospira fluminis TaxID=2484979 RepID=A0A4R9GSA5_9LEPT|nr:hypothetical protein EHO61_06500 [Leptospira fluminis]
MGAFLSCSIFFVSSLEAFTEEWAPNAVQIGQKAVYTLEFSEGEILSPEIPSLGIYPDPESPDLPLFEVFVSNKDGGRIRLEVAYYSVGTFVLPLNWTDSAGAKIVSKAALKVESSLQEKDKSPEDILPPDTFSGPYGWRLAGFIAGIVALLVGALYAYYLHKTRSKAPMDAILQADPWITKILRYESMISELMENDPISARDFYRCLSGWIREAVSQKLSAPTAHLTESELFSRIYDSFPLNGDEAVAWERLLKKAQYSPQESTVSREEAIVALDFWKEALQK